MTIAGFSKVAIIGAGQMGHGIAQVCASYGLDVKLIDINKASLEKAQANISKSLEKMEAKGRLQEGQTKDSVLANLSFFDKVAEVSDRDLVIEAIIENEKIKLELFSELDKLTDSHCILASNTSSIPITRIASATNRPDKVIGMHFMNPVPIMKLVEVISGMATSDETKKRITELSRDSAKEVSASQDYPGFVVNRILMPMINESFFALMEGVASKEDIDKGMKLGTNQPMGPLTLADFIGLDTCLAILNVLHEGLGDPKYRPCPLLVKYEKQGFSAEKQAKVSMTTTNCCLALYMGALKEII